MKKNYHTILDSMEEINPDALYPTNMEKAIIGVCLSENPPRLAMSYSAILDILAEDFSDDEDPRTAAVEFFEFNVAGSWMGEHGPIYVYDE